MITQKPILLKIKLELLDQLDCEVKWNHTNRNFLINAAVDHYLKFLLARRRVSGVYELENKRAEVKDYCKRFFPEAEIE